MKGESSNIEKEIKYSFSMLKMERSGSPPSRENERSRIPDAPWAPRRTPYNRESRLSMEPRRLSYSPPELMRDFSARRTSLSPERRSPARMSPERRSPARMSPARRTSSVSTGDPSGSSQFYFSTDDASSRSSSPDSRGTPLGWRHKNRWYTTSHLHSGPFLRLEDIIYFWLSPKFVVVRDYNSFERYTLYRVTGNQWNKITKIEKNDMMAIFRSNPEFFDLHHLMESGELRLLQTLMDTPLDLFPEDTTIAVATQMTEVREGFKVTVNGKTVWLIPSPDGGFVQWTGAGRWYPQVPLADLLEESSMLELHPDDLQAAYLVDEGESYRLVEFPVWV
jgi:hypothetical protein